MMLPRSQAMTWLAIGLAVGVVGLDVFLLNGQGEAVLYVIVVLIFLWSAHWRHVLVVAAACCLLTLAGSVLSTKEVPPAVHLTNHAFSFLAIWLTAILGLRMNRLADALAASEARTRAIVESAAEGIITINERGTIQTFNDSAAEMFGYDSAEILGHNVKELMPAEYRDAHEDGLASYLDTGEKHIIGSKAGVQGLRKDGTTFPVTIAVSEMRLQQTRFFTGILMDMTELRLAQDRAVQAQRLAAIGEAMAGLAHESRNALQRSQSALEMLARAIGDQTDATDLVGRIQSAQDDLHCLYEEVRGYAAPICVRMESCQLDDILKSAWEDLSVARAGRDAQLAQATPPSDWTCELDPVAMRRVFRNILENSLAACADPVRIAVSYSDATLGGQPAIKVTLYDNGPGIDEAVRHKIFEPFVTTKTSGTGLGMAIAKRYVEAHHGAIDVPANSGRGVEFRITVPRAQP